MIQIIKGTPPEGELPHISVESYPSPKSPKVTISNITGYEQIGNAVRYVQFPDRAEMKNEQAVAIAVQKAQELGLDKVYSKNSA